MLMEACLTMTEAGTMTYHPTHGHNHTNDWGVFTRKKDDNEPDPRNWPIVSDGAKLGFALWIITYVVLILVFLLHTIIN